MNLYRILVKGKSEKDSWFFMMDIFTTLEDVKACVARHQSVQERGYRIVMLEAVVFPEA